MIKAINVQYQNFNGRFEVVKYLKKLETCSEQKKLLEIRKVVQKRSTNLWTALTVFTYLYIFCLAYVVGTQTIASV